MAHTYRTTLLDLADAGAVETYMKTLLDDHRDATRKREVVAYLQQIVESDKLALRQNHLKHKRAIEFVKKHSAREELTAQTSLSHIMAGETRTVDQLMALLHAADGVLFGVGYTFDNASFASAGTDFKIKGNNAQFLGESNGQSARENKLQCTCLVKATLNFDPLLASGVDNVTIKGVKFMPSSEQSTVTFSGKTLNLKFENCIFDGSNNAASRAFYGAGNHFEGTLVFQNCIFQNYKDWMLADPSTHSSTPTTQMKSVLIDQCLFKDNMGSMAFRNVQDPVAAGYADDSSTFTMTNNKFDVSGLTDVHNLFWSAVECNNFKTVRVNGNVANCFQKLDGTRGFFQCWSRGPEMDIQIENNQLSNYNIGYQIAMGDEQTAANASFKGCPTNNADKYFIKIANEDLTNVETPTSFVYPWDSTTGAVNLVSGFLPTVVLPHAQQTYADLTGINNLIEEYTFTNEAALDAHIFQLGSNSSGYVQINCSSAVSENSLAWFKINVHSTLIENQPFKLWQDQITVPAGASWNFIEQERSFSSGVMTKRNRLDENYPAGQAYMLRLYFRIT